MSSPPISPPISPPRLVPIDVGGVRIQTPVYLAPMSGVTDLPFRRLARAQGTGMVVSEMIASQAMVRENRQTLKMAEVDGFGAPSAVQLAGCEPGVMAEAAKLAVDRGAAIIDARGLSSAASAANAAMDHVRNWVNGTPDGDWVSMGIPSDGSYGIPEGLMYGFPVTCKDGQYSIVKGIDVSDFSRSKMQATQQELEEERDGVKHLLG